MREQSITFQKAFKLGLRVNKSDPRNQEGLVELKNVRVGETGLEEYEDITQPFTGSLNWPYSDLRQFEKLLVLFDETSFYEVDPSDWSKSTLVSGISSDLSWHSADFIDYIITTNGSEIYERNPDTGTWSKNTSLPGFKTCDQVNGRLIIGNISNHYDCDNSFVAWSQIGEVNFEPDLKNLAGYAPAKSGEIYHVKKLGKGFVAYGSSGIRGFQQSGNTFGQKQIANFGIASRDAIGGTEDFHIFLADDGSLWQIDAKYQLQKVGYEEFFSSMVGNDIKISYNPNPGEFYISDGDKTYLLYKGLSQIYQIPGSVIFYNGNKIGIIGTDYSPEFYLKTDTIDFNLRAFKKIETIELGVDSEDGIYAAVEWRSRKSDPWRISKFQRVNDLGNVYIGIEAVEFRIVLTTEIKGLVNLDYLNIQYKLSDKRTIRGQR